MDTRLVVGCGSIGHAIVDRLSDRPGEVLVLDDNERRVQRLREEGITATRAAITDPAALRGQTDDVMTVVVAGDTPRKNRAVTEAVADAFPESFVLAYAGADPDPADVDHLRSLADDVIDSGTATSEFLMGRVSDDGRRLRQLRQVFWDLSEPLAIVAHDNPDPDAIASAVALQRIADALGVDSEICYYGDITHQENRAFVNLLGLELTNLGPETDLSTYGGFALVDHSRAGVNDQLPPDTPVDIVIDHHPPRAPVDATFVDLRSDVGATSTLMVEYLRTFGIPIDETVATGLLFGIRVDTRDFSREVSAADFEAAAAVTPQANLDTLERIESPSVSTETFETIARAIRNRERRGPLLVSFVGDLSDRDALAQAADRLLDLEGVTACVVAGLKDGVIYISGRARGTTLDLGETLRDAFDQIGSAGGHADMAGAQIPVADTALDTAPEVGGDGETAAEAGTETGTAAADTEAEVVDVDTTEDLQTFVAERFYEAIAARPQRERTGISTGTLGERGW